MQKAHFQSIRRFLLRKLPLFDLAGDRMSSKDEISVKANEYFEFLKKQYDEYPKVYESLEEQKEAKKISDKKSSFPVTYLLSKR